MCEKMERKKTHIRTFGNPHSDYGFKIYSHVLTPEPVNVTFGKTLQMGSCLLMSLLLSILKDEEISLYFPSGPKCHHMHP